jgi:thiamine monophosphate synthase
MKNYFFLTEINKINCRISSKLFNSPKLVNSVFFTNRNKISNPQEIIKNLPKHSAIIFREYDLPSEERLLLAKNLMDKNLQFSKNKNHFIIGKDYNLAKKIKAQGVHFSDHDKNILPFFLQRKSLPKNFIFSLAIHHERSVALVKKLKPDLIFFSPIFKSSSHLDQRPFGLINFSRFLIKTKYFYCKNKNYQPKIYALGGINFDNIKKLRKINIAGFGAIELFKNFL